MKNLWLILLWIFSSSGFGSAACYQFFFIKRPVVAGAVEHEFVVAQSEDSGNAIALGLLKGNEDLQYFLKAQREPNKFWIDVRLLGTTCGENARKAIREARDYSNRWMEFYQNSVIYLARMGATPVMGKPCRNAALEIAKLVEPYLE